MKPTPRLLAGIETTQGTICAEMRGFEEDVKDEDVFANTTMTASLRMLLSQATDLRNEEYSVHS